MLKGKPPRPKTCKICKNKFQPITNFQPTCTEWECIKANMRLKQKQTHRKAKKDFNQNDISYLKKQAQTVVNKYIRIRDKNEPCISCGYTGSTRQIHAGHYRAVGNTPQLRYYTLQINAQCSICNNHLSGNVANYRMSLIKKLGLKKVEEIEVTHHKKAYSTDYLQRLIKIFKKKTKRLDIP